MKYATALILALALLFSGCGCRQGEEVVNALLEGRDSTPPVLLSWEMTSATTARLSFDEPVVITSSDFSVAGSAIIDSSVSMGSVTLTLAEPLDLGTSACLEGRVEDLARNSLRFSITLWAKNPNPATLLINEFTTKGTEANPDRVELVATSRGNLAGMTLYAGTAAHYATASSSPTAGLNGGPTSWSASRVGMMGVNTPARTSVASDPTMVPSPSP